MGELGGGSWLGWRHFSVMDGQTREYLSRASQRRRKHTYSKQFVSALPCGDKNTTFILFIITHYNTMVPDVMEICFVVIQYFLVRPKVVQLFFKSVTVLAETT